MFRGESKLNIDAKGRMAMPARQRERLLDMCAGRLVATIDIYSPCLMIFPLNIWEEVEKTIQALPSMRPETKRFQRLTIGRAAELEMDANGRVLIPQILRQYAKLDKQVALVGQGKKYELWNSDAWEAELDKALLEVNDEDAVMPDELLNISF